MPTPDEQAAARHAFWKISWRLLQPRYSPLVGAVITECLFCHAWWPYRDWSDAAAEKVEHRPDCPLYVFRQLLPPATS